MPLRLRKKDHQSQRYIIPLRDRPGSYFPWAGVDWAARVIEEMWTDLPVGAFWQALTGFPEVWQVLAQRPLADLMRPWSRANEWTFWHPGSGIQEKIWDIRPEPSFTLSKLTEKSCPRPKETAVPIFQTCEEMLQAEIRRAVDAIPPGHLWGMIICGALAPTSLPRWLTSISTILEDRGVQLEGSLSEPHPRGLWLTAQGDDPIAEGASIYGHRTWARIPTYLDTLPQLSIYAMKQCQYDWVPLVDAVEWEGGKEYYSPIDNPIEGKFKLRKGTADLDVYLKKREQAEGRQEIKPYRMAKFNFPLAPEEDKILDLEVRMRPASGMAKVQIIPREASFLRGRPVFLDYSTMVPINELPELEKGAPDITKFEAEPQDNLLLSNRELFARFQNIAPPSTEYFDLLKSIKKILSTSVMGFHYNRSISFKIIDQDGKTDTLQGQELIDRLSKKVSLDFSSIIPGSPYELKYYTNATWLFLRTPSNVTHRLIEVLSQAYDAMPLNHWNWSIEAGSRSFSTVEAFSVLFTTICERINRPPQVAQAFPIQSDRRRLASACFPRKGI